MNSKIKLGALGSAVVGRVPVFIGGTVGASPRIAALQYWDEVKGCYNPSAHFGSNDEYQSWNEGAPPFPGWWNAHFSPSDGASLDIWRWWDGERWSAGYLTGFELGDHDPMAYATSTTYSKRCYSNIKWNDRWPEGARVPRMIPEGYEQFEVLRGICGGIDLPSTQLALPLDEPKTLQQQLEESDW